MVWGLGMRVGGPRAKGIRAKHVGLQFEVNGLGP